MGNPQNTTNLQDMFTLPKTYNSPLKIGLPKRNVIFQPSIFQARTASFREGSKTCYLRFFPFSKDPTLQNHRTPKRRLMFLDIAKTDRRIANVYRLKKTCQIPGWSSKVMKTNWWNLMKHAFKIHHRFDHVWPQNTTFNSKTQQNKQTNDVAWCSANSKTNSKRLDDTFQRRKFTRPWFSISDNSHCVKKNVYIYIYIYIYIMYIYIYIYACTDMYTYFQSYHIISYPFQTVKFFLLLKFHSKSLQPHPRCTKPIPQELKNVVLSGSLPVWESPITRQLEGVSKFSKKPEM